MEVIREHVQELYAGADLLGFAVADSSGAMIGNDSAWCDDTVQLVMTPFIECVGGLAVSDRQVKRLSLALDDCFVVGLSLSEMFVVFFLDKNCQLDSSVKLLDELHDVDLSDKNDAE